MHVSGEFLSNSFTVNLSKQDAQGAGSALTYCRRYSLQAIAGIPSEDDDGNNASRTTAPKPTYQQPVVEPPKPPTITKKAILDAFKACKDGATLQVKYNKAMSTQFAKDPDILKSYQDKAKELSK